MRILKSRITAVLFIFIAFSGAQAQTKLNTAAIIFIDSLISEMSVEEKLGQINQYRWVWSEQQEPEREMYRQHIREGKVGSFLGIFGVELTRELQRIAVEESRLGIPLLFAFDVIHGWRTIFPVPLAAAGSWNPELVEQAARVAALESSAQGVHWTFAPMIDIARDPRWGRIVEGAGEDPYLASVMAVAQIRGFQGQDLGISTTQLACAKHFCAYGAAEGGRDYNTADMSERTLREIYLPPFRAAVDADVATFMVSFNEVGGIPMHANNYLINHVLHGEWDFKGFGVSDYTGINELLQHRVAGDREQAGILALTAGVDMDMDSRIYLNNLEQAVNGGRLSIRSTDQAVKRILAAKYKLGLFEDPYRYHNISREQTNQFTAENRRLAKELALEFIVLLKNENNLLPLSKSIGSLAVIGALAADQDAPLGSWRGIGEKEDVIPILEGIRQKLPDKTQIYYHPGYDLNTFGYKGGFDPAVETAKKADAVLIVLGETASMSGEANNRSDISLPGDQLALAKKIISIGKPVAILLMNGRPLAIPWLAEHASAIIESWFLGTETGTAVADVLFGDFYPSGKLPVTFPRATGQIPIYYNHKNTGRPPRENDPFTSKYLDLPWTPQYPFGFGLSYTTFTYSNLRLNQYQIQPEESIEVSVDVENTGSYPSQEIVQLYVRDEVASITPVVKKLRGFSKIGLEPAEKKTVRFKIGAADLSFYNQNMKQTIEPGVFKIFVGGNSQDVLTAEFTVMVYTR